MILLSSKFSACSMPLYAPSATGKACGDGPESRKSRTMTAEDKFQTAACTHQPRRQVHQLLHHGLYPASFGEMAHRGFSGNKSELSDGAQNVVSQSPKSQDQGIGGKFARWEPFHVHVRFDLSMELLACATTIVKPDHIFFGQIQCGPPSLNLDFRGEKTLPAPVDGALDRPHHPFEHVGLPIVDLSDTDSEQSNSFSVPGSSDRALIENPLRPLDLVFSSGIPFYDIADIPFARQGNASGQSHVIVLEIEAEV